MSAAETPAPEGLAARFWVYQAERFPLVRNGVLIALFALGAMAWGSLIDGVSAWPPALWMVSGVVSVLLFFFQLRVADEHKDFAEDSRYRPERAVPRGLISLKELRRLAWGSAALQLALVAMTNLNLLIPLLVVWAWIGLMTREFFAPEWLKARPVAYLVSHMAVMPPIGFFALACGTLDPGLDRACVWAFLVLAFLNGLAVEIARKAWAPEDEREGVETWSKLWGPKRAALVAGAAVVLACVAAILGQLDAKISPFWFLPGLGAAGYAGWALWGYAQAPTSALAKRMELAVGVFTLVSWLGFSILPLLWRTWTI